MKKLILSFTCLFFTISGLIAQDATAYYKKAKKSFDKYQQSEDGEKLQEALSNIQKSIALIDKVEEKKSTKIWMKAGEIYNEIALGDYKIFLVNNNHRPIHPNASAKAYEAFWNTIKTADKKWDKSEALDEILKTATFISNEGIVAYNIESYEKAYQSFKTIIDIRSFLNEQEHVSILNKKSEYQQHLFRTALAAQRSDHDAEAIEYFEQLEEAQFDNPAVYTSLFELYTKESKEVKALAAIKSGRSLFPDNDGLMIAEINHYLNKGELDQLTSKLEAAIEKKPQNVSLYSTLGHVYNELHKSEAEQGNFTASKNHFQQSMDYFSRALEVNGTYAPALYNLGALYYNSAAILTNEIKSLEGDTSAKGIRAVSAKRAEMLSTLDKALPYFQRAEAINPNDEATLGALKEIYTRKNDQTMSEEFASRLEKVSTGESIEQGYFDN